MIFFSCLLYLYMVLLTLFSYGFQNSFQCCIQNFKPIVSIIYQPNPVQSSEYIVPRTLMYPIRFFDIGNMYINLYTE